jgi:phage terminase large subunit-like protein
MNSQGSSENLATELQRRMGEMIGEAAEKKAAQKDLVSWIKKEFWIPETKNDPKLKGHLQLQPYQEDVIREALSRDENGKFKYSIIVWSDIKKSIKSTIAAAVNLARAWHSEYGEYYVIANDLKQADSRVAKYIRRAIELNPKLRREAKTVGYTTRLPSRSFIEAIPIDPTGEAGSNADQLTWSELWGSNEEAQGRMWAEMTLSPTKRGESFRWIESYAGYSGESLLLYSLYELGVKKGKLLWPDKLYHQNFGPPSPLELYVNKDAGMLCLWNTVPRCPWQVAEYYREEKRIQLPNEYSRMHENQWVTKTDTFVPMQWLYACKREEWPKFEKKRHPMVIALDAGVSDDNFGMWMGGRHPAPQFHDEVIQEYVRKWVPPEGGKIDFQGTDEEPGPEKELRRLIKEYNVVEVAYDPHQLHDMATRLMKEGLAWFRPFNQGDDRLLSDSGIRTLIRDRKYWYRGEHDFEEHVQNADAKIDSEDRKIRIVKRADQLKIDILVAASMGSYEVLRLNL